MGSFHMINEPARRGAPWSKKEVESMLYDYSRGAPVKYLAKKHKRTVTAIEYALDKWLSKKSPARLIINGKDFDSMLHAAKLYVFAKVALMASEATLETNGRY